MTVPVLYLIKTVQYKVKNKLNNTGWDFNLENGKGSFLALCYLVNSK